MKVILLKDVEKLGEVGDIVEVADGYGRNFLIPRGLAVAATEKNKRQLEHQLRMREHRLARLKKEAQSLAERLRQMTCHFTRKAGEEGKLFGSVTALDIAEQLQAAGIDIDRRRILLEQPIKSVGEYTVPIRLGADVVTELKVTVAPETA
ncbi:MAG: 50S ribosomal protein L9 [Candidatus Tectimicrobiota bacterium]|nr:MAG: 50S ribosomal protein L9 [Candidatus Tectomicrobia bacterium]